MPDLDILYLSEIDPTWNNDELNVFLYPESLLLANPIALAVMPGRRRGSGDPGKPRSAVLLRRLLGPPLSRRRSSYLQHTSMPRNTSLLGSRTMAQLHRLGLARRTMGDDTVCSAVSRSRSCPRPNTSGRYSILIAGSQLQASDRALHLSLGRVPGHSRHRRGLRLPPLALAGLLPDRGLLRMIAMHRVRPDHHARLGRHDPAYPRADEIDDAAADGAGFRHRHFSRRRGRSRTAMSRSPARASRKS